MAQSVERILGKDEVTGSIPVISSKKAFPREALFLIFPENRHRPSENRYRKPNRKIAAAKSETKSRKA